MLHAVLDYFMSLLHLAQNREVGWMSFDRRSGKLVREQQPILKKLKLLFLFNPLTEWIDTSHLMRLWAHERSVKAGKAEATRNSANQIKSFVDFYHINMNDFEPSNIDAYPTFEDFFVRTHVPGSRPVFEADNSSSAVCIADARVVTYESVSETKKLWIKGSDFSITNLVMDTQLGPQFADGPVASFRLSPQDYHRYHSPVTGTIKLFRSMPGDYYQVDPLALRSSVNVLTLNARDYVVIDSEEFGEVLFVAIGATDVGSVRIHDKWQKPGSKIRKGDELGIFQFGESSIIVAFQQGRIKFDEDLLKLSAHRVQVAVEVGMSLGVAVKSDG